MYYIVFDLEFNQNIPTDPVEKEKKVSYPYEIIQIGAYKLDADWKTVGSFNRFIKPEIYSEISPFITELTGITTEQLKDEETFAKVYQAFLEFIGTPAAVLCSWSRVDIKELYRSVSYFEQNADMLPKLFLDLQPYASLHLHQPRLKQLRLQYTVEALKIPLLHPFHDAIQDAYYTAEVFRKIMKPTILPEIYNPDNTKRGDRPRQPKRVIDFVALIRQFEKMYNRPMTEEEQTMIKTAYQMGKTGQFVK